jgi:hypothetical protein
MAEKSTFKLISFIGWLSAGAGAVQTLIGRGKFAYEIGSSEMGQRFLASLGASTLGGVVLFFMLGGLGDEEGAIALRLLLCLAAIIAGSIYNFQTYDPSQGGGWLAWVGAAVVLLTLLATYVALKSDDV